MDDKAQSLSAADVLEVVQEALAARTERECAAEEVANRATTETRLARERLDELRVALSDANHRHADEVSRLRQAIGLANSRLFALGGVPVEVPK